MSRTLTLIRGDGIGPEVSEATLRVLDAAGCNFEWDEHQAGLAAVEAGGEPLPLALLDSMERTRVGLKGPVTTPVGKGFRSVNVELRKRLRLFANVRPVKSTPGLSSRFADVDLIVVRENTEGLYSGIEHQVVEGVVESLKIITEVASTRIARFAFELARQEGRGRITAVHKANIMKLSDGLFLECFHRVAAGYPDIEADERIVDNMAMQLVMRPERFDVLVLPNLYGDILSDLCAGLVGGLGVVPGANLGADVSIFEAVHGSAPDIAGQNLANPTALIRSAVMMLRHLGMVAEADRIDAALLTLARQPESLTRDVGGAATTSEYTDALVAAVEANKIG